MLYKRPNFKMGGSPTGIESLTPRVKARTGFGFLNFGHFWPSSSPGSQHLFPLEQIP